MSNWMQDYMEQHALGAGRYGWTTVKSLHNDKEIKVRIFDAPPPKEWGSDGSMWPERPHHYRFDSEVWIDFGRISGGELAEWCGIYCDFALPMSFCKEYERAHGVWPHAVWAYRWRDAAGEEVKSTHGEPFFIDEMLSILAQAAYRQMLLERRIARRGQE